MKENPDPRGLSRGEIVRIEGNVYPMSLLKFEMAIGAFSEFTGDDIQEAFHAIDQPTPFTKDEERQMEAVGTLMESFTGDMYPLRIESGGSKYCTELKRDFMRQPVFDAFVENEKFTLVGRVKKYVKGNETWNPFLALNIIDKYVSEEESVEEFQDDFKESGEELNISIKDEDFEVQGHTAVIEPIAVYW
ncbi:hypothetical protein C484_11646 [Natrialba taiwanensis DSM 12281]|uniref:Uncharacterized protein n=2 Tax=Natrialba taiwanensis TaxID=160846 RepID=L9ZWK3_9EURY|nr:hypothetical protein C484_11646 [Natrialba taiwanensis DSM 12281]